MFVSNIVVFVIIWWLVFLMLLPVGNKMPKTFEDGHVQSAPENPNLIKKIILTSLISVFLTVIFNYFLNKYLISINV